jgi:hypothetical protein
MTSTNGIVMRLDILVEAEEVGRIVLVLKLDQLAPTQARLRLMVKTTPILGMTGLRHAIGTIKAEVVLSALPVSFAVNEFLSSFSGRTSINTAN